MGPKPEGPGWELGHPGHRPRTLAVDQAVFAAFLPDVFFLF